MMIKYALQYKIGEIQPHQLVVTKPGMQPHIFHFLDLQGVFVAAIEIAGYIELADVVHHTGQSQFMTLFFIQSQLLRHAVCQVTHPDSVVDLLCDVLLKKGKGVHFTHAVYLRNYSVPE